MKLIKAAVMAEFYSMLFLAAPLTHAQLYNITELARSFKV